MLAIQKHAMNDYEAFSELFLDRENSLKCISMFKNGVFIKDHYLKTNEIHAFKMGATYDYYITLNDLKSYSRASSSVVAYNGFMVDIDYLDKGLTEDIALTFVYQILKDKNIFQPSMIYSSGRGLWLLWKIEPVINNHKNITLLWKQIQSDLVDAFHELGADSSVKSPGNLMRMPSSINQKKGKQTRLLNYTGNEYTLEAFKDEVSTYTPKQKNKARRFNSGNVRHIFNEYTLHRSRYDDILTLLELRDYDVHGQRNNMMFLVRNFLNLIGDSNVDAEAMTSQINDELVQPLSQSELKSLNKDNKLYHYKNETLIELLGITEDEQKHLKTLIGASERNRRRRKRYKPIKEANAEKKKKRDRWIMNQFEQGLTNKQVIQRYKDEFNKSISLRTIQTIKKDNTQK